MIQDIKAAHPQPCCRDAGNLFDRDILRPVLEYVIATRTYETVILLRANYSTWRVSFCPFCGDRFSLDGQING